MNQSSFIAAMLLAGFVLFLAANNRLSAYTAVLWGTPSSSGAASSASSSTSTSTSGQASTWSSFFAQFANPLTLFDTQTNKNLATSLGSISVQ